MAFPTSSAITDSGALTGSSHAITLPTHTTGDRLVVQYVIDAAAAGSYSSHTSGWDIRINVTDTQSAVALMVFERVATGASESLTITLAGARNARAFSRILSGTDTTAAAEGSAANSAGTPSTTPNPPSVTPSWGAADTFWLTTVAFDNSTNTLSSYPADYADNQSNQAAGTSSTPRLATASRARNATSEDPGNYTFSGNDQWVAATLAFKPAGGGDTTAPTLTSPAFTATGATTGTASVSTDEGNGTLWCVVTTSATSPSVAQIKAGNDHTGSAAAFDASQAVSGTGTQNVNATGLTASTLYYAHFVHTDAAANDSTVSSDATGDTTDSVDTTAPVLSSPVGTATGTTTATVGATTDEGNGTLYAFVSTSATPPSDADLIAGTGAVWAGSQAVTSTGAKTLSATGLTASTGYYAHLLHRDAASNDSNTVTSALFTTDAAVSNDIRLAIGIDWEEGGEFASQTVRHWSVWSLDGATMHHSGTSGTTSSGGVLTIDIDDSAFEVGDDCLFYVLFHDNATDPLDRTVRTVAGYITTTAQA
jgi:hypothetical protein